ncbi:related to steroid monooxygenase [Phialocephala subalpina]|uniref:Related to steroid monooxygenase n=1 Tax=Phialocephala subalpina TaxID=576137 RepID=A0A1L7XYI4_9HELO|nr:related to steroid monooxygenase [Phialocephala subalpina]
MSRSLVCLKHQIGLHLLSRQLRNAHLCLASNYSSRSYTNHATRKYPGMLPRVEVAPSLQELSDFPKVISRQAEIESSKYRIQERPLGKCSPMRVVVIGAGISGLNMIHTLQKQTTNVSGEWIVAVKHDVTGEVSEDRTQVLVDATGIFNEWKWPNIEGLHSFKGQLIHTANWPRDFQHHDKTVAVLGNGASGVQIVPAIQPDVKKLVHFIRARLHHRARLKRMRNILGNLDEYTEFTQHIDDLSRKERFKTILNSSEQAQSSRKAITRYMTKELRGNEELITALIPTTPVGCRRITGSTSYLESLAAPNVELARSPIQEISATGIIQESGRRIEVDAIICATGFNTSFVPRFPIVGENGWNLQDVWLEENGGPKAYMSIMAEGMPNYFRFFGPNGPLAHGVVPRLSSYICSYILAHIRKMQFEHISSVRPLPDAVEDFNEHVQAFMPRTAWAAEGCGGWYKSKTSKDGKEGRVIALHPGSQTHWEEMLSRVRWEDFEFRRQGERDRSGNRFAYLGNGFTVNEVEGDDLDQEL